MQLSFRFCFFFKSVKYERDANTLICKHCMRVKCENNTRLRHKTQITDQLLFCDEAFPKVLKSVKMISNIVPLPSGQWFLTRIKSPGNFCLGIVDYMPQLNSHQAKGKSTMQDQTLDHWSVNQTCMILGNGRFSQ